MQKLRKLTLTNHSVKYKLKIAFYLMSILPWLVSSYLVFNYFFAGVGFKLEIIFIILISIFIAVTGFLLIKEIFDRLISVNRGVKHLASGELDYLLEVRQEDELGELSKALNQFTQRIRNNMDELKTYSQKTTEINLEINKRIFILSNLLQISSLISKGGKLEEILKMAVVKSRLLANSKIAYFFIREEGKEGVFLGRAADGAELESITQIRIDSHDRIFNKLINEDQLLMVDKENILPEDLKKIFYEKFKMDSTLAVPVNLRHKLVGILGIASTGTVQYTDDDVELLGLFAKQLAIAMENDYLAQRLEKLEIKDTLTGLYNEVYIYNRLGEEIRRAIAYQRPCAFILFSIDNFQGYTKNFGLIEAEESIKKVASLIKGLTSEVDRVARTGNYEFAVVTPEKNKRQAQTMAENIRKKIESTFSKEPDVRRRLTVSGSVSENPLDGVKPEELISKAHELLKHAEANNIVIALKRK